MVPEGFIPKKPRIIDPDLEEEILKHFPNDKSLQGEFRMTKSHLIEKKVRDILMEHFKEIGDDVLIICGLELLKIGGKPGE